MTQSENRDRQGQTGQPDEPQSPADPAAERGERTDTGRTIARGGKSEGEVPGGTEDRT
jgi:hypothetical protein